jgi:hypothetical protein
MRIKMTVDLIHVYWQGVLQRLQAEVDQMNQLIAHEGVKGTENEGSLVRLLERLLPARYAVGTGLIIDSSGASSKQMDVVVYEASDEPTILAQTNQVLFPIENVRLCIEVKTTLDSREVDDAREKKASIDALFSITGVKPQLALFAYASSTEAKSVEKYLREERTVKGPRPDFTCVVKMALLSGPSRLTGLWRTAVMPLYLSTGGEPEKPASSETGTTAIRDGHSYPLVKLSEYVIAEPSRALLVFCEQVVNAIRPAGTGEAILSSYITTELRREVELEPQ